MEMSPAGARLALRVMRSVARADGETEPEASLRAAAADLLGADPDVAPITAADAAAVELSDVERERVVQAAVLMALMDGEVTPSELGSVRGFASALGVDEPRVRNLAQLAKGRIRSMWLDLARRSWARDVFVDALKTEGPLGVWKIVGPMLGRATDPALARRYIALGELPEDTFGHAYFRFVFDHELPFPGEPHAVAESGVWHDCAHTLGGYGVTPPEEIRVVSFIAGFSKRDPFFWLFTITLQFHLGIAVSPYSAPETGLFDPPSVLRAFERGAAMTVDLSAPDFDPWAWFERPLDEVRRAMNVPPR